jgi:hypothetical protein
VAPLPRDRGDPEHRRLAECRGEHLHADRQIVLAEREGDLIAGWPARFEGIV